MIFLTRNEKLIHKEGFKEKHNTIIENKNPFKRGNQHFIVIFLLRRLLLAFFHLVFGSFVIVDNEFNLLDKYDVILYKNVANGQ